MKVFTFLAALILISTNSLSQVTEDAVLEDVSFENKAAIELDELDDLLNLNEEQEGAVYEIIFGILHKNDAVHTMKLIEEDKKAIIKQNGEAKIQMIMDVLVGKQKELYKNHVTPLAIPDTPVH